MDDKEISHTMLKELCAPSPANNQLLGSLPKAGGHPPIGAHGSFQLTAAPVPTPVVGRMPNPSSATHPAISGGPKGLGAPSFPPGLKNLRKPSSNPPVEYTSGSFMPQLSLLI